MSHDIPLFTDLIIIIAAALPIVFLARRMGLPSIAGFVATGVLIGPYGIGLIQDLESVESAAEIGVVLLLFTVGLEFSLSRLISIPAVYYAISLAQILVTAGVTYAVALSFGATVYTAVIAGFVVAISSTAVVLKGLADKGELESPSGRLVIAIAIAQDLAVIPMLLAISFLAGGGVSLAHIIETVLVVVALAVALFLAAKYVLPNLLNRLVAIQTSELILLFTVLVLLGTAWLTSQAGLSLAIGAFAAGLILAETPYLPQIFADVAPFRSLFSSLFFVSIGMLLDLQFVMEHPLAVIGVSLGVIVVKTAIILAVSAPFGIPPRTGMQAGLYLAQIGEFAFLVITAAMQSSLLGQDEFQFLIAASALTLGVTPIVMQWAPRLTWNIQSRFRAFRAGPEDDAIRSGSPRPSPAILIVGFGLNGQNVSRALQAAGLYHEILESNPEICRRARADNHLAHYGDCTSIEVLQHIVITEFESVVLAVSDPAATRRAVSILKQLHPTVHLIVRTRYVSEVGELERLGANTVVPEEFETSLRIFSSLLAHYNIPPHIVAAQINLVRGHGYGLLRLGPDMESLESLQTILMQRLVEAVAISDTSSAAGRSIVELGLNGTGDCIAVAFLRDGKPLDPPFDDVRLHSGDLVVLFGNHEALYRTVQSMTAST